MYKPYDLLENVLIDIEVGIREGINAYNLAEKYKLSERHLRRLFQFAFKQSIAGYIRSRKLTASLDDILKTDKKIINIAFVYGFDYEQSFIRAFKGEFGITPGDLRKYGQIIKVKPPLFLFNENNIDGGVFFGPDIVMVPQFHIVGKNHNISLQESVTKVPQVGKYFLVNERTKINNTVNPDVYIGLTYNKNHETLYADYLPSVQVKDIKNIPQGFSQFTFESCLCARFRYIGQHHYYDLNSDIVSAMLDSIWKFAFDEKEKYALSVEKVHFERIDTSLYDGTYCQLEWFTPVIEK